jgi:ATP-dependent Lon protease
MTELASPLPLLPLRHGVVLPSRMTTIPVGRPRSRALANALSPGDLVILAVQRDPAIEDPSLVDLHSIATLARVTERTDRGARGVVLVVDALARVELRALTSSVPYWMARAEEIVEPAPTAEAIELMGALKTRLRELISNDTSLTEMLATTKEPGALADRVPAWLDVEDARKVEVLLTIDPAARLRLVIELLAEARAKNELRQKIESEVRKELGKNHKEAMLRQQMRAIQKELGEEDANKDKLRDKLDAAKLPDDVREVVDRELRRLDQVGPNQAEANVIRTYLEWIADLPWTTRAPSQGDLDAVESKLESDHYGLADVKRRILEHMAVLARRRGQGHDPLRSSARPASARPRSAQSIADATGRPLVRVALGGVRDEAEIRGHRRTYVGALPGRVVHAMRKAKVKNPVVVLDEIDKLGRAGRATPGGRAARGARPRAEQAPSPITTSSCPSISRRCSSFAPRTISRRCRAPLRDRLEIIEVSGYTTDEKLAIAKRHLVRASS